jgi:hypothetical protein
LDDKPPGLHGLTSIVKVSVSELPAVSSAVTVMILSCPQWRRIVVIVQLVVPEADPEPPLLLDQVTEVTPTLSEAVPPMLMVLLEVE